MQATGSSGQGEGSSDVVSSDSEDASPGFADEAATLSARSKVSIMRQKISERHASRVAFALRAVVLLAILLLCLIILLLTTELNKCRTAVCPTVIVYNTSCTGLLRKNLCFEIGNRPVQFTAANASCHNNKSHLPTQSDANLAGPYLEGTWTRNGSAYSTVPVVTTTLSTTTTDATRNYYCVRTMW
uniref:Protein OPG161 n=1 Tax=Rousettus bat poxvirus TaxID=3141933 RepID=A0AAU7E263_9POXV